MASLASSPFLLALLICCCFRFLVDGRQHRRFRFHVVSVDTLVPEVNCSGAPTDGSSVAAAGRKSTMIHHRYGPCSTVDNSPHPQREFAEIIRQDKARVQALHQRMTNAADGRRLQESEETLAAKSGGSLGSGNYVVTIGIGTPKVNQTVIIDTGSGVCWVQCQPCRKFCHEQQGPIFDPSVSTTYRNVSCSAAACQHLDVNGCSSGTCVYGVEYGDNSTSVGFLAQDTLTIASTGVFEGFVFGCGQRNKGFFGRTDGLLGLSRKALSAVTQTSEAYGGVFSYCLPVHSNSTGVLTFGGANSNSVSYTPMLTDTRAPSLYFLELTGISVGRLRLPIPSTVFSTAGTIVDSGTVITRLPPAAYAALRSAFRLGMSNYTPGRPVEDFLDTCYDLTGHTTIAVPAIALHFGGGAVLHLTVSGILVYADITQVCLAFAPNSDDASVGIVGNKQQRGHEVVHDVVGGRIGFGRGPCF